MTERADAERAGELAHDVIVLEPLALVLAGGRTYTCRTS